MRFRLYEIKFPKMLISLGAYVTKRFFSAKSSAFTVMSSMWTAIFKIRSFTLYALWKDNWSNLIWIHYAVYSKPTRLCWVCRVADVKSPHTHSLCCYTSSCRICKYVHCVQPPKLHWLVLVLCCSGGCLLCMLCFLHELFPLIQV